MYREDADAMIARLDALERDLAQVSGERDAAVARVQALEAEVATLRAELARRAPPAPRAVRAWPLATLAGGAVLAAIVAVVVVAAGTCRHGGTPARSVASSPSDARALDAPARDVTPAAYFAVAEVYGAIAERLAATYPDRASTTAPSWTATFPTFKFYVEHDTSLQALTALAAAGHRPIDAAALAYLRHLGDGLPRIADLQDYFRREDYKDDGMARWDREDAAMRAWFARHRELRAALRSALATQAGDGDRPSDVAACAPILPLLERGDPADDDALQTMVAGCRALAVTVIEDGVDERADLCDQANFYRRERDPEAREQARRHALASTIFALQRMAARWIGDEALLPPPGGYVE